MIASSIIAAGVMAGGAAYAANKASKGAKASTKAQVDSNNAAIAQQNAAEQRATALQAPWREVGLASLGEMARLNGIELPPGLAAQLGVTPEEAADRYGGFEKSPGYQFRLDEGQRAITGNMAAKGLLDSGALGKGLIRDAQDYASNEFGAHYARLAQSSATGQIAAANSSGIIGTTANNVSNLTTASGDARAAGAATQAGIQSGLISNLGGIGAGLIREYGGGGTMSQNPASQTAALQGMNNFNNTSTLSSRLWGSSV